MPHVDAKVLEHLNIQLTHELTAINQYFLHARMLEDWGVTKLGKYEYKKSIQVMRHADELIKRILYLTGIPNVQRLNPILIGQNVREVLDCDLKLQTQVIADFREAIAHCEAVRDYVTRELLQELLEKEEEYDDELHIQFRLIESVGIETYIHLNAAPAPEQAG